MRQDLPAPVPEIPVQNVDLAAAYYAASFGFSLDWGGEEAGGIAGISREHCRLFLTNGSFRTAYANSGPVVIWLNLESTEEVDRLYEQWSNNRANIVSPPESKPWKLHEFTAADLDGNFLRVFYDFSKDDDENKVANTAD